MTKYLIAAIWVLFFGCVGLYNLWDSAKTELNQVKAEKLTLEQELKRRNENEKNLSKRISELSELYSTNADWADSSLPPVIASRLSKQCKACK